MHIDWWTLGLQTINALVLVWLLARFLFKPVANMVAERQRSAAALMSDAAAAKDAALGAQKQAAAQLAQIAQQHAQLLDTAHCLRLRSQVGACQGCTAALEPRVFSGIRHGLRHERAVPS
jgi:F0F1-type ATP synthase membrane subunit b/b'